MRSTIQIGQLNVRIPGESAESGYKVANGVAESLARKVPPDAWRQLGAITIRVPMPAGASEAEISDAISDAVVRALHRDGDAARGRQD